MSNFEAFRWVISSSTNHLFLKSDNCIFEQHKFFLGTKMCCSRILFLFILNKIKMILTSLNLSALKMRMGHFIWFCLSSSQYLEIFAWCQGQCFIWCQDQILDVKQIFPLQAKPDKLAQYQGARKKDLIVVGGMLSIELKLTAVMAAFSWTTALDCC